MSKFLLAVDAGHGKYVGGNRCLHSIDPNQTAEWVLADRVARQGLWSAQMVHDAVDKGIITEQDYQQIVGGTQDV